MQISASMPIRYAILLFVFDVRYLTCAVSSGSGSVTLADGIRFVASGAPGITVTGPIGTLPQTSHRDASLLILMFV
jgi:hypothetical protein